MGFFSGIGKVIGSGSKYLLLAFAGTWAKFKLFFSAVTVFFVFRKSFIEAWGTGNFEDFFRVLGDHILRADTYILEFFNNLPNLNLFSIDGLTNIFNLMSHIWFLIGMIYLIALFLIWIWFKDTSSMPRAVMMAIAFYLLASVIGSYALGLNEPWGLIKGVSYVFTHLDDIALQLKEVF